MASIVSVLYDKMFTSELSQLHCSCENDSMQLSIRKGTTVIMSQTYYPDDNNRVTIYDLDKLLEGCIDEFCKPFTFLIDEDPVRSILVFKCNADVSESAETFHSDFFFSPAMGERDTALGRYETVTMFCTTTTAIKATCTYLCPDGSFATVTKDVASFSGWQPVDVSPSKFADEAFGRLIAYVISAGSRKASYRVIESAPEADPAFIFRNCFDCWETIYLTGAKQTSPSYTRSNTLIEGQFRTYDIEETVSYKAFTGPLRPAMVPVAMDLARSKEIYLLGTDGKAGARITVTDVDVKHTNEDNSIPDFSFTYRRASRRTSMIDAARPPRLFDDTFDDTHE